MQTRSNYYCRSSFWGSLTLLDKQYQLVGAVEISAVRERKSGSFQDAVFGLRLLDLPPFVLQVDICAGSAFE